MGITVILTKRQIPVRFNDVNFSYFSFFTSGDGFLLYYGLVGTSSITLIVDLWNLTILFGEKISIKCLVVKLPGLELPGLHAWCLITKYI